MPDEDLGPAGNLAHIKLGEHDALFSPGLHPLIEKANEAKMQALGKPLSYRSSYRTNAQQVAIWNNRKSIPVARPGHSEHESGNAFDSGNPEEDAPFLKQVGLVNDIKNDLMHFHVPKSAKDIDLGPADKGPTKTDEPAKPITPGNIDYNTREMGPQDKLKQAERPPIESFSRRAARAVAPYTKEVLPFAGAVAGGLAAAPANLIAPGVAEAVGVGLGGAAGIQGQRMIEDYAGIKKEPTKGEKYYGRQAGPVVDALSDMATMVGTGAVFPEVMAAKPGLEVVGKAAGEAAEATLGRRVLSKETGVPLTPAQTGQSKSTTYLESQLRRNMWSADEAAAFDAEQKEALQNYTQKVQEDVFGGKTDPTSAGETAKSGAWERITRFRQRGSKLYDQVPVEPKTPIETENLSNTAKDHLDELGKLQSPSVKRILGLVEKGQTPAATTTSPIVDEFGRPITTETPPQPTYTWEQLRNDQSELGKLIQRTSDPNQKRILGDLQRAITDDISAFAETVENPEIKSKLKAANNYWRMGESAFGPVRPGIDLPGMGLWNKKAVRRLLKEESPEKIGQQFFKARPNRSDIRALKDAAGEEGFNAIRQSWLEDMLSKGEDGSFNHNRFITAYENYKRSGNLDVMLTKSQREGLDKLAEISKAVAWSERVGGNPSGTGHVVINNLFKLARHPIWSVSEAIGAKKLAQNYFKNPEFQERLVTGLRLPGDSPRAKAIARQLVVLAGVEERENLR